VGLVWPPRTIDGPAAAAIEDALLQDARAWLTGQGIKLCQALLTTSEAEHAHCLVRNQFRRITGLSYLARKLPIEGHGPSGRSVLSFQPFSEADPELFAATLEATYEETRDFPELNGIRTRYEVLAGHQAQGTFDPSRWWLVREGDQACGVLLTSSAAEERSWEVIYMGLVRAARGRQLGRVLLAKAGKEAADAGARRLTLCVDERNQPARKLYQASGFEQVDRREVFLAILQPPR
jgi:ribosomal protein S18 acetylase RimI-like enzyme